MAAFIPANRLEELLVRAATDPAARPDFYRELLCSKLYVLTPEPPLGERTERLAAGGSFSLVSWKGSSGSYVPMFSSRERVDDMARHLGQPMGFLALEGKALFDVLTQHPDDAVLNPGFPYGKQFSPDEIRAIAEGSIFRAGPPRIVKEATQVLLGQPASYPQRLVDTLVRLFRGRPSVHAAFLAQMHVATEPAPEIVIGLLSADYAKDAADAGLVAKEVGDPAVVLTIHRFSASLVSASIASAAARTRSRPRAMVTVPGGPPDDLPV